MISLMVIFILLLLVFLNNQASVSSAATHSLQEEMKRRLEPAGFHSIHLDRRDPFTIVVAIPPDLMTFEPNSHELKSQGAAFLHSNMPKLVQLLCDTRYREKVESVIAEGYADNSPFRGASFEESRSRNLKLSQERALEVVETSLAALSNDPGA
jgi:flagellar motor protein MotB